MPRYSAILARTASTTASVGSLVADATRARRGKIFYFLCGCEAAPADNPFLWQLQRITAAGTSTAVTPASLDPGDIATEADPGQNHSVEPTYTANTILLTIPLHQRNTFKWEAPPYGELVYPATASNGFGVKTPTATALAVTSQIHWEE
jgi:hypothetical protein